MLPWTLSALTIIIIWLMGNKSLWGPRLGFFGQGLWIWFAISSHNLGLLPSCVALLIVYGRAWRKWARSLQ